MNELDLFAAAIAIADPVERASLLDRECAGNPEQRARIDRLLAAHDRASSFLERPAAAVPDATSALGGEDRPVRHDDEVPLGFLEPSTKPGSLGRLGHYEILEVLGRGGFGIVLKAFDDSLHRVVAVKVLSPEMAATSPARKRFLREARASAPIRHENVVQVYAIEETPLPYIVMEFVPGRTLQTFLDGTGPLEVPDVVRIGVQIARGLAAAHELGLIHRDIKPANILLEGGIDRRVKITDFGLARAADDASITASGVVAGTPLYMAPEQARGEKLDHRADLFSLGSVLYTMCSGHPPFRANSTLAVLKRVCDETPRPIPEIIPETPRWLCDIISRLHAKNPDERFQSAKEVADLLTKYAVEPPPPAKAEPERKSVPAAVPRPSRSNLAIAMRVVLAAVGVLFLGAVAVIAVYFASQAKKPADPVRAEPTPGDQLPTENSLPTTYKNALGMEFALVPKGKGWLGGGNGKPGDKEVEFKDDFYLGVYEVTQEEWEKVMGKNPSYFSRSGGGKGIVKDIPAAELNRFPVENVSWDDCQAFLEKLNERAKETGWTYRLPHEAEWEYACRGGPMTDKADGGFNFYLTKPSLNLLPGQASSNTGLDRPQRVGSFEANRLGLHEMHGNVQEWCLDQEEATTLRTGIVHRVTRGGTWAGAYDARKGWRFPPEVKQGGIGLRVARVRGGSPSRFKNSLGMEFALVPKGKGWLGGGGGKPGDKEVEFRDDFYLGVYEVTQEEWEKVVGANPSYHSRKGGGRDLVKDVSDADLKRFPVEHVSWNDTQVFLEALNQRDKQSGWVYRLPTEDEWEYACRGGPAAIRADHAFDFYLEKPTNQLLPTQANIRHDNWLGRTCKVGLYPPNRLGLHDMHGNVAEWCDDELTDEKGAVQRPFRGGAFWFPPHDSRAARRQTAGPSLVGRNSGLRVVRVRVNDPTRYKNSLGMEFSLVPKGKGWLGGGGGKPGNKEVEFKEDFYLGVYEVTQEEWGKVTGSNPSHFSRSGNGKDAVKDVPDAELKRFPVEAVSWDDAQAFLEKLNQRENQDGWMYRLPTAAEWEYACRGGPSSDKSDSAFDYYFVKPALELKPTQANFNESLKRTCKVGSYGPNRLGLHDLHGNVNEWCADLGPAPKFDEKNAWWAIFKGGRWNAKPDDCRALTVGANPPSSRANNTGLRVARVRVIAEQRKALEWVLEDRGPGSANRSYLGLISQGKKLNLATGDKLPEGSFQECTLSLSRVTDAAAAIENLTNLPKVTAVSFHHCPGIGDKELAALSRSPNFADLTGLVLNHCAVTAEGLLQIKQFAKLTTLTLGGSPVSARELAQFRDLQINTLTMFDCKNAGDEATAVMVNYPHLESLGLPESITDASLVLVAKCKSLKKLVLPGGDGITEAAIQKLAAARPDLRIERASRVIEPKVVADPDRNAAEWVLSIGGSVRGVPDAGRLLKAGDEIPPGDWKLNMVNVVDNPQATDAGLAVFKDCRNLNAIYLSGTPITDAGLAHFKDSNALGVLVLDRTAVTDAGLAVFKDCRGLQQLSLMKTGITDKGLVLLGERANIGRLLLGETKIGDTGLAVFKDCEKLVSLDLRNTRVTEAGLAQLRGCKNLMYAHLDGLAIGDSALAVFKDCKDLRELNLNGTQVGDTGLEHLKELKTPGVVRLKQTKVTAQGAKKLAAARPELRIEWDGGIIEPKAATDPDRRAAEWVLSAGGTITINERGASKSPKALGDLPQDAFQITNVWLPGIPKVTDAGLANFKGCTNLVALNLSGTQVTDAGLTNFKDCKGLVNLELHQTAIGDAGLAHFKDCKGLQILGVSGTRLSDAGLAPFQDFKNLEVLDASGTVLSDAGLAHLKGCTNLKGVTLTGTKVGDAGLAHLKDCKNLTNVTVAHTTVGDAGLAHLKDCKNLTVLNLGATKVSDAGLVHFKDFKDLAYLNLADTPISDAGLANFKDCKKLRDIHLNGTQITDAGLAYFKECKSLWALTIFNTKVSDAGLVQFKDAPDLVVLRLNTTQVSDVGLAALANCPKLGELSVKNTKVTEAGVKKLAATLSKCKIEWDGGVIEPK